MELGFLAYFGWILAAGLGSCVMAGLLWLLYGVFVGFGKVFDFLTRLGAK